MPDSRCALEKEEHKSFDNNFIQIWFVAAFVLQVVTVLSKGGWYKNNEKPLCSRFRFCVKFLNNCLPVFCFFFHQNKMSLICSSWMHETGEGCSAVFLWLRRGGSRSNEMLQLLGIQLHAPSNLCHIITGFLIIESCGTVHCCLRENKQLFFKFIWKKCLEINSLCLQEITSVKCAVSWSNICTTAIINVVFLPYWRYNKVISN